MKSRIVDDTYNYIWKNENYPHRGECAILVVCRILILGSTTTTTNTTAYYDNNKLYDVRIRELKSENE